MNALTQLRSVRDAIVALKKIADKCDPASGVSFSVRRGVSRDNEDLPDDRINRPWITVEVSDTVGQAAIDTLLSELRASESYWRKAVERDVSDAQKYLNETYKQGTTK